MLSTTYLRSARGLSRLARRTFASTARQLEEKAVTPASTETPAPKTQTQVPTELPQAPNRKDIWSRSQRPRQAAMTGPRFEQTDFDLQVRFLELSGHTQWEASANENIAHTLQPQSYAAIELIHKQPVRWTHDRVVACDGGGGPAGHPRIFINTDKPEISVCNYCGLPFVSVHPIRSLFLKV